MKKNLIAEDKMEQMLKNIEEGILGVANDENFKRFLKFQSKNYSHSIKNIILANQQYEMLQMERGGQPPLQSVGIFKGIEQWQELGRDIKPGEIPLEIFSPIIKKKLERDKKIPYVNYKSLKVGTKINLTVVLRDIIYSGKGLYVYMLEIVTMEGKEIQGLLRATSKSPLEFKKIYKAQGKIEQFRAVKQVALENVSILKELDIKETSYCAGFKLTPVYSQHQTFGDDIPTICNRLEGESANAAALEVVMNEIIDIPITYEQSNSNGYYVPGTKLININPELKNDKYICQRIKTLIHEYAHYQVDILKYNEKIDDISMKSGGDPYALEELVAESVAYMICSVHEIDTSSYSFEYLASWSCTNVKLLKSMFEIIQRIYSKTIKEIIDITNKADC
ncbi:MAG: zincin-like metallopeptidase domain-containing protein [Clostridium sp.]